MKIGVYGQSQNELTIKYVKILIDILVKNHVEIIIEEKIYSFFKETNPKIKYKTFANYHDLDQSIELFFSVGGDGTFLRSVTFIRDLNIPIIGINTGRLGFLATVQKENIEQAVQRVLQKKYTLIERTLLCVKTNEDNQDIEELNFALNEVAISRKNTASMITVETLLDDEYLTTYWSDGLIIATPTGSTGYSLSCNGPIISPQSKNIVLTPIAPHSLSVRPLVIPDKTNIELKIESRGKEVLLTLDSRITTISNTSKIYIQKCDFTIKTVQIIDQTFIKTLREKLFWGEDKRN
ncbi:MAG: NAD kinase [Flavobacteriaceae bacterium]|nr:NAD kinase [Flavobacteriaceae bacterium]